MTDNRPAVHISVPTSTTYGDEQTPARAAATAALLSGAYAASARAAADTPIGESDLSAVLARHLPGFAAAITEREIRRDQVTVLTWGRSDTGIAAYVSHRVGRSVALRLYGPDDATVAPLATALLGELPPFPDPEPNDDVVPFTFVFDRPDGIVSRRQSILAPAWSEIAGNYTTSARRALSDLMTIEPGTRAGKLVLFHGPAGTGKTTALRALGRAWARWCNTTLVLDPEALFNDPGYVHDLLLGDRDDPHEQVRKVLGAPPRPQRRQRWQLVILEDTDELIAADARRRTGQALSRLLNVADGILGQGLRVLIALTTNEPVARLHPAITRPGRCLADIGIGPLTAAEARAWLHSTGASEFAGAVTGDMTLADLYALVGVDAIRHRRDHPSAAGTYL